MSNPTMAGWLSDPESLKNLENPENGERGPANLKNPENRQWKLLRKWEIFTLTKRLNRYYSSK